MSVTRRTALTATFIAILAGSALVAHACTKSTETRDPEPADVVAVIGPVRVTDEELNRFVEWSKRLDPALSPAKIRRITVTDFWLPYRIARGLAGNDVVTRAKDAAEEFHRALVEAGGDFESFRRIAKVQGVHFEDGDEYVRAFNTLPMSLATAAFETPVGGHTGPLASTLGYAVLGVIDERFDGVVMRRLVMATFPFDSSIAFGNLVKKQSLDLWDERSYVHPRYRVEFENVLRNLSEDWPPPQ
ncbi:MAG: peptidyl-prolyl cis-trans isomerase [Planctomycetes bacterium]|nr:peptidyl-prolyl cis-trans isomerase [Planctomycetota bacterium]MCB9891970.1 peptidyl-prolyl cis-trans isomerase [Planctomycetota bacterium]MCB9919187.1 peptidyl-prolyl cis-trans isomerase [Planctomycetota bacterium]